jgi:hypothetical protein
VHRTRKTIQRSPRQGRGYRRPAMIAAATILAIGALAGTAAAVLSSSIGGQQVSMHNRGDDATALSPAAASTWVNLPGSGVSVNADSKLINARFTAESTCSGESSGVCAVRIVAVDPMGVITPLDPASDLDFAFDTDVAGVDDVDGAEAHAMERSRRLQAGQYTIGVQYAVTNAATTFKLDDWHFAVAVSA